MILKADDEVVAHVPGKDFRAVCHIHNEHSRLRNLTLSEAGKDVSSVHVKTINFVGEPKSHIKFMAHWIRSHDVGSSLNASFVRGQPAPHSGELDREWLSFMFRLMTRLSRFCNNQPGIHDFLSDMLLDYLRTRKECEIDDIHKLYKSTKSSWSSRTDPIFANLLLHHRGGFVECVYDDDVFGGFGSMEHRIATGWISDAWRTKDWSDVPQDILADDFDDYCRYHTHGNKPCHRVRNPTFPTTLAPLR